MDGRVITKEMSEALKKSKSRKIPGPGKLYLTE